MPIAANPNGSWSERNIATIANCMDSAFANVLSAEFDRLTAGMSSAQVNDWLVRSERSIQRLRNSNDMPDYSDPMVVLRYVIRYQLGHINLAYTLVKNGQQRGQRLTNNGALQVVDFGAGTLAMSYGVALAVADALADGENISAVRIDAIDTGGPMLELGQKLWNAFIFISQAEQRNGLGPLTRAVRLIQHSQHSSHRSVQKQGSRDCWLTALHVLYDSNEREVSSALTTLSGNLNPSFMALTCYSGKSDIAGRVVPTGHNWQRDEDPTLRFNGTIDYSRAAAVAFDRGFNPSTWSNPRLYTGFSSVAAFISRVQVSPGEETWREVQEEARKLAQSLERVRQQRQQEETWREVQEEARKLAQSLERVRQQRQQQEARRRWEQTGRYQPPSSSPGANRRRSERVGISSGSSQQSSSGSQSTRNTTTETTGGGCLLPVLGAAFFGVAGIAGAIGLGLSMLL